MSKTTNYDIPYLTPNQTQREDVYNQGMNIIDSKIKELEEGGGAVETGEIRKFLKKNIPEGWYEVKSFKDRLTEDHFFVYNFDYDSNIHANSTNGYIFKTSSGLCINSNNTTSTVINYIYDKKIGIQKDPSFFSYSGFNSNNIRFFNKEGSNIIYRISMGYPSFSFTLSKYNMDNDTIISEDSYSFDPGEFYWNSTNSGRQNGYISIDKEHQNIYIVHNEGNSGIFIVKFNIVNETIDTAYYPVITDEITNFELGVWNNSHVGLIYFNNSGNIVVSCTQSSGNPEALQINKDTLGINRYTNNALIPSNSDVNFNSSSNWSLSSSSLYTIWYGDSQILYSNFGAVYSGYENIISIKNYNQIVSLDELWGVDFINTLLNSSQIDFTGFHHMFTDTEYNVFFRGNSNIDGFLNINKRLDGSERFEDNKIVECVYGVPQ